MDVMDFIERDRVSEEAVWVPPGESRLAFRSYDMYLKLVLFSFVGIFYKKKENI